MSTKAIGTQELVFATILGFEEGKNSIAIHFEHATNGSRLIHRLSMDKLKYENCYKQLEAGQTYIIVEVLVKPTRWVWTKAVMCSKPQARTFFSMTGIAPTVDRMATAMSWLKNVQRGGKKEVPNTLLDQVVTW